MPRPPYAPTYAAAAGWQSAYTAGLSHFPDVAIPAPLGNYYGDVLATGVGTAVGGPAGGAVAPMLLNVIGGFLGSGATAVDQARLARVAYFADLAARGNVAAAQLILGGPANVSGNERQMWVNAATMLQQAAPDVLDAARDAGPVWLSGSGDTATNYPVMRQYVMTWANQHPGTTLANAATSGVNELIGTSTGLPSTSRAPSVIVLAGLGLGAYMLLGRRRR